MKRSIQQRLSIGIILAIVSLGAGVLWVVRFHGTAILGDSIGVFHSDRSDPNWGLYIGKPSRPNSGSSNSIPLVSLSGDCTDGAPSESLRDVELRMNEAILIPSIADMPVENLPNYQKKYGLTKTFDHFLILQGWARTRSTDVKNNMGYPQFYPAKYLRLRRNSSLYDPMTFGATTVAPYETSVFWVYFPVEANEKQFTVEFCTASRTPQMIPIDFTSEKTRQVSGTYSSRFGLLLENVGQ